MTDNVETMAWVSERPWHGLGAEVTNDLTPEEMMIASGTNWTVSKAPLFAHVMDREIILPEMALVRDTDQSVLDIVGADWLPKQNSEAFDFFKEFTDRGSMTMETAGSLQHGKIVWALAKVGTSFTLFGGDKVEAYLLFTNPHKYGSSIDVRFTGVRVVCNNTLTMALNGKANNVFKASHRVAFDNNVIKETLGMVEKKMEDYMELAALLGSREFSLESVEEYFDEVFPSMSTVKEDKKSRNAKQAMLALTHQPGVEFAPNSWWQALNAVTYVTDHIMGRTADARVTNAWYGQTKDLKLKAMKLAKDFADKA